MHLNFLTKMLRGLQFVCRALLRSIFLNVWHKYGHVDAAVSSNVSCWCFSDLFPIARIT